MLTPDQMNHPRFHPLPDPPDPVTAELVDWKLLDAPRQKALAAILGGKGVQIAAQEAEVHRGTVYRWMRSDPHFCRSLAACRQLTKSASRETLHSMIELAAINVRNAIRFGDLRASIALLRATRTLAEVDSEQPTVSASPFPSPTDHPFSSPPLTPTSEIPSNTANNGSPRATVAPVVAQLSECN